MRNFENYRDDIKALAGYTKRIGNYQLLILNGWHGRLGGGTQADSIMGSFRYFIILCHQPVKLLVIKIHPAGVALISRRNGKKFLLFPSEIVRDFPAVRIAFFIKPLQSGFFFF